MSGLGSYRSTVLQVDQPLHPAQRHNEGTATAYTRNRRPVVPVYSESHSDETVAVKRELQIKNWGHAKKEALIRGDKGKLRRLSR